MKKQISLKWKIARYLMIFGVLVIALLFVFQMLLLQPMYETNKISSVKSVSDQVVSAIQDDTYSSDYKYQIEAQSDTCIRVFSSDEDFVPEMGQDIGCRLYRFTPQELNEQIANAYNAEDNSYLQERESNMIMPSEGEHLKDVIYTRIISNEANTELTNDNIYVVMVYTSISAVNAATKTLSGQLLYIGIFMVIGIAILTLIMHRQITKPLSAINASAKSLPEGHYDADPKNNRYLEAQELNETLAQAAEDIQKADKAKRDLIANVSHDLRTPLTMISGYGEMMIDLPAEKTDENLQVIVDESKRLNQLVNDLLDLSKLQESKITLAREEFDLRALIENELRKYDVYRMQEGFDIETDLPQSVTVNADPKRIAQVFNNFMTNAINYSGDQKKIIVREAVRENAVRIEVQDFGEGIAEKNLANVWDRYYKIDKEHVRAVHGSGIGLAIVKEILDLHHAKYGVNSKEKQGSTFWFELEIVE